MEQCHLENVKSFDQLPLNIIFRVLFYLDFQDLYNVSQTCRTLRILSNESMTYHRKLKEANSKNWWTKRLLFDFFNVMDGKRHVLDQISLRKISVINALRRVQEKLQLGSDEKIIMLDYHPNVIEEVDLNEQAIEDEQNPSQFIPENNSDYDEELSGEEDGYECDDSDITVSMPETPPKYTANNPFIIGTNSKKRNDKLDKEGLTYIKILQGFHKIATNSHKKPHHRVHIEEELDNHYENAEVMTPTKSNNTSTVSLTPVVSIQNILTEVNRTPEYPDINSPDSYDHSRSTSSVFSDTPKLTERVWSFGCELEHLSHVSNDSDSSSSEFIKQLQKSKKVKDKKFLYEKLMAKNQEKQMSPPTRNKELSYASLKAPGMVDQEELYNDKRRISQKYLEELERCNSPSVPPNANLEDLHQPDPGKHLSKYKDHVESSHDFKLENNELQKEKTRKTTRTPHRRKLKAFVTDGNRICYEKL